MKWLIIFLVAALGAMQYKLWWGQTGLLAVDRLQQQILQQQEVNRQLQLRNHQLHAEVLDLKQGLAAILGAVLGAAIGDALGHPTEFLSIEGIEQRYGPKGVLDYVLFWEADEKRFAPYTDDTQMAEQVFRALGDSVKHGLGLDATMRGMAERFIEWSINPQGGHRAPGRACQHLIDNACV